MKLYLTAVFRNLWPPVVNPILDFIRLAYHKVFILLQNMDFQSFIDLFLSGMEFYFIKTEV